MAKHSFFDLNVSLVGSLPSNVANVKQLQELGYATVAINAEREPPVHVKDLKANQNPFEHKKTVEKINKAIQDEMGSCKIRVLARITIHLETVNQIGFLRNPYYQKMFNSVDLVAVKPGNEKVLKTISEGKVNCDIISLDLAEKMDFIPTPKMIQEAVSKGFMFEIPYTPAIKSATLRRHLFRNSVDLVRRTKQGKGIIVTSQGEHQMDFRSPSDVINLSQLFSLTHEQASNSIQGNSHAACMHADTTRYTTKGLLAIEKLPETSAKVIDLTQNVVTENLNCVSSDTITGMVAVHPSSVGDTPKNENKEETNLLNDMTLSEKLMKLSKKERRAAKKSFLTEKISPKNSLLEFSPLNKKIKI